MLNTWDGLMQHSRGTAGDCARQSACSGWWWDCSLCARLPPGSPGTGNQRRERPSTRASSPASISRTPPCAAWNRTCNTQPRLNPSSSSKPGVSGEFALGNCGDTCGELSMDLGPPSNSCGIATSVLEQHGA